MTGRLADRTVMITGAASGIGAACARMFTDEGAAVILCDRDAEGIARLEGVIAFGGKTAVALPLDVTDEAAWDRAFAEATARFPRIDALVNSAGRLMTGPLEDATTEQFDDLVAVNLKGVFLGCRAAVRHMAARDPALPWASIVNVSSTAGLIGTPNTSIYTLTKGGVRLFSKSVAVEMGERGLPIRCNSLHPGTTDTTMFGDVLAGRGITREAHAELSKTRNLIGRIATAEEIAAGALYLVSTESSFMTGSELVLDGGYSAR